MGSNGGLWVTGDVITADRSNWKGNMSQDATPSSAFAGQVWSNTSYSPSTLTVYGSDSKWYPATVLRMGGDRIAAQSNTYAGMQSFCTVTASSYTSDYLYVRNANNNSSIGLNLVGLSFGTQYVIGNDTIINNNAEKITGENAYTKMKEIYVYSLLKTPSTIRIKFDLKSSNDANVARGKIYKNGSGVGTERTTAGQAGDYLSFSEDLSFSSGDTVELWSYASVSYTAFVRNFIISGSESEVTSLDTCIRNGGVSMDSVQLSSSVV